MVQKITCPDCGTVNEITEDQFCTECGLQLRYAADQSLHKTMTVELRKKVEAYAEELRSRVRLETDEIALQFMEKGKTLKLTYTRPIIFGRGQKFSPTADEFVDLTPYDAYVMGLSREHARILYIDSGYVIEDIGSSNGTVLNGELLTPKRYYPLHNGDQVALARLEFIFHCG